MAQFFDQLCRGLFRAAVDKLRVLRLLRDVNSFHALGGLMNDAQRFSRDHGDLFFFFAAMIPLREGWRTLLIPD